MQTEKPQKNDYPLLGAKKDFSKRIQSGYKNARKAAVYLKNKYSVQKVLLFGSLVNIDYFHNNSDIDIAVEGLPDKYYYQAVGELMDLIHDFPIDVVDLNACNPGLKKRIIQESISL